MLSQPNVGNLKFRMYQCHSSWMQGKQILASSCVTIFNLIVHVKWCIHWVFAWVCSSLNWSWVQVLLGRFSVSPVFCAVPHVSNVHSRCGVQLHVCVCAQREGRRGQSNGKGLRHPLRGLLWGGRGVLSGAFVALGASGLQQKPVAPEAAQMSV